MTKQGEFSGFFAEFYDILHAGLGDVEAYVRYASRYFAQHGTSEKGSDILELGSGTGRILIPLAAAGFNVTGVDNSDGMISLCTEKLSREPSSTRERTRIVKGDVIDLDLGETFDLVIAPCNLLSCMTSQDDALSLLKTAKRHLKDNGVFILDCSIPDVRLMVESNDVTKSFEFTHPVTGTTIIDTFTPHYDFVNQLETDHIVLEERDGDAILRRAETTDTLAFYFPREVRLMLAAAGLSVFHEQGSLAEDVPLDERAGEMVFFARKAAK
jgi:SAM-dependent methyltransferase